MVPEVGGSSPLIHPLFSWRNLLLGVAKSLLLVLRLTTSAIADTMEEANLKIRAGLGLDDPGLDEFIVEAKPARIAGKPKRNGRQAKVQQLRHVAQFVVLSPLSRLSSSRLAIRRSRQRLYAVAV